MTLLRLLWAVYFTQLTTQAELTVQAEGYEQVTAQCILVWCEWDARDKRTGEWEHGSAQCNPTTLNCEVTP